MTNLTLRTLTPDDFPQMYRSFIEAFSQYTVNMSMSKEAFEQRMIHKLNLNYDLSPAAFDSEKLVGFIFHTINNYEVKLTAYNGGTGVIPGYWGQNITKHLHDFIIPNLKNQGVKRCVLEVITTNEHAINAYFKSGYSKTKLYKCFKLLSKLPKVEFQPNLTIQVQPNPDFKTYQKLTSYQASMLDSFTSLSFSLNNETVLEVMRENEIAAYAIYQHKIGRISQFSVKEKYRRQGIGTALLHQIQKRSSIKNLTVINVEKSNFSIIAFLNKLGFENQLDQWEMELGL